MPLHAEPYDLDVFKNPTLAFPADPVDHIVSVRVRTLRVRVHGRIGGQITVDTGSALTSVYDLIRANFAADKATLKDVTIVEATLQAQFERPGKRNRSNRLQAFCKPVRPGRRRGRTDSPAVFEAVADRARCVMRGAPC